MEIKIGMISLYLNSKNQDEFELKSPDTHIIIRMKLVLMQIESDNFLQIQGYLKTCFPIN